MPLPGGPSDKLGNRYELRWVVRKFVDLVTGRITSVRIEPPGEDAIEFRCQSNAAPEAYQIKRGVSRGHWAIAALRDVLTGFGTLLAAERKLVCTFGSEHAAPELNELSERARDADDYSEFTRRFLGAHLPRTAWRQLCRFWGADGHEAWNRLRRIVVLSISEEQLESDTETILQLLFDKKPERV